MKLSEKYEVAPEFAGLLDFETKKDEFQHEASILAARFLSEINKICEERGLKKKDLAKNIGTSASYITQIFTGDKQPNMLLLAKFQDALDIVFEIKAKPAEEHYGKLQKNSFVRVVHISAKEMGENKSQIEPNLFNYAPVVHHGFSSPVKTNIK